MEQIREFKTKSGYEYGLMYLPSGIFSILPQVLLLLPDKETKKLNSEYELDEAINFNKKINCNKLKLLQLK